MLSLWSTFVIWYKLPRSFYHGKGYVRHITIPSFRAVLLSSICRHPLSVLVQECKDGLMQIKSNIRRSCPWAWLLRSILRPLHLQYLNINMETNSNPCLMCYWHGCSDFGRECHGFQCCLHNSCDRTSGHLSSFVIRHDYHHLHHIHCWNC